MTRVEAIEALVDLAKDRIGTIDGEWGCCHEYDVALSYAGCRMHKEAVELQQIIDVLTGSPA